MFQKGISRKNSTGGSDKRGLTEGTPAEEAPGGKTPKETSSKGYFERGTVKEGNGGGLH